MSEWRDFWKHLQPRWRVNAKPDPSHSYGRTLSRSYQLRKRHVKTFWIIAGWVVLIQPLLHVAVIVTLFTTFISFMYLDESDSALSDRC